MIQTTDGSNGAGFVARTGFRPPKINVFASLSKTHGMLHRSSEHPMKTASAMQIQTDSTWKEVFDFLGSDFFYSGGYREQYAENIALPAISSVQRVGTLRFLNGQKAALGDWLVRPSDAPADSAPLVYSTSHFLNSFASVNEYHSLVAKQRAQDEWKAYEEYDVREAVKQHVTFALPAYCDLVTIIEDLLIAAGGPEIMANSNAALHAMAARLGERLRDFVVHENPTMALNDAAKEKA